MEERELIEKLVTHESEIDKNTKQLGDHETRIKKLEDNTAILEKMDYRMGNVEKSVDNISSKIDANIKEQTNKKTEWFDYIVKGILTILIGYIAIKLGLK